MSSHHKTGSGSAVQSGYGSWATNSCSTGKRSWVSRADAKGAANRAARGGFDKLRPYLCEECDCWHLGHLPRAVRSGAVGRTEFYGGAR